MALIIPDYREPGAYSTIVPNPTTATASGPPIVAIVGQALRGPYEPQLFFNSDDAQLIYGVATKGNPLPLGIQIAFENGAPRVLGVNVEPQGSTVAFLGTSPGIAIAGSNLPTSVFAPAATGDNPLLDPVTNQPVNTDGTIAGVFYVQDFDPTVADPVLNATPQATQQAFGLAASGNLLQYIKYGTAPTVNGVQQVPLSNSNMIRFTVPAVVQSAPPQAPLSAPAAPTLAGSATGGVLPAATYNYKITAVDQYGETLPSPEAASAVTTTGTTSKVTITWTAVTGAASYNVYGRTVGGELKIANVTATTYVDDGSVTPAGALPTLNTSGAYQAAIGTVSQTQWNQLQNAMALVAAINSTPNSPITAEILVPDSGTAAQSNTVAGYTEMFASVAAATGYTVGANVGTIKNISDAYAYACAKGVLRISALEAGTQHEIVMGLFAASTFDTTTGKAPFGLPTSYAGASSTNPYIIFSNGVDGVVTSQSYIDAINNKLTTVRADIIVVLSPDATLQQTIKDHVTEMSSHEERNERIAFVSGPINESYATSIANAQALQGGPGAQRMVYVWPTGAYRQDPVLRSQVILDGTFLAAACAGIMASHDAAEPLTRKTISGFIDVTTKTTRTQMNNIAQNGVCIIENNPTYGIRVRHGITCDPTTAESREISVVRQLDFTAQTVRDLLDINIVATKITANTLAAVTTLVTNALQQLKTNGIIYGFKDVSARISPLDPTQIDVRFTVRPAYPCNYIEITMSVSGDTSGF